MGFRAIIAALLATVAIIKAWQVPLANSFVLPPFLSKNELSQSDNVQQPSGKLLKSLLAGALLAASTAPTSVVAADRSTVSMFKQSFIVSDSSQAQSPKQTKRSDSDIVGGKTKMVEEIALEGAVKNRDAGKARVIELEREIKKAKQEIATAQGEKKKLLVSLEKTETRLRKKGIDNDIKRAIMDEKNDVQKRIDDRDKLQRALEKSIERKEAEILSLLNRLQTDEATIKQRTAELKKKREFLVAQEESKRVDAIKKEIGKATREKEKADSAYKGAVEKANKLKEKVKRGEATLKGILENEDKINKQIESLQKALDKQNSDFQAVKNKETDLLSRIAAAKTSIQEAEKEAKDKEALSGSLKSSIERMESSLKKR